MYDAVDEFEVVVVVDHGGAGVDVDASADEHEYGVVPGGHDGGDGCGEAEYDEGYDALAEVVEAVYDVVGVEVVDASPCASEASDDGYGEVDDEGEPEGEDGPEDDVRDLDVDLHGYEERAEGGEPHGDVAGEAEAVVFVGVDEPAAHPGEEYGYGGVEEYVDGCVDEVGCFEVVGEE